MVKNTVKIASFQFG